MTTLLDRASIRSPRATEPLPAGGSGVSASRVAEAILQLSAPSRQDSQRNWLGAVARLAIESRPDLTDEFLGYLRLVSPSLTNPLKDLSVGTLGVVYEALLALSNPERRKSDGQFFTPDDVAQFMAAQSVRYPAGTWLDPCCGVGNLSWHLANAMPRPDVFIANQLTLVDLDPIALKTAVVLLTMSFAAPNDRTALSRLAARAHSKNFLTSVLPDDVDFVIVNPPYATAKAPASDFRTGSTNESYAYFMERVIGCSDGFIAITPASFLSAAKYGPLRSLLDQQAGGEVLVFDNVPDTCFRGYKYGSTNTSKTNFVRAAITVAVPMASGWKVTPILRWAARSRAAMWENARSFLGPLRKGPNGEWAKIMPGTEGVWDALGVSGQRLLDLVAKSPTAYWLEIASTPRYYISASKRSLDRGSKHRLYFRTPEELRFAYLVLNSSLPYWWWRCIDGGVTLTRRTLLSLPLPVKTACSEMLIEQLEYSDHADLVSKLNAGRQNENIRRPRQLIDAIDKLLLPDGNYNFAQVYAPDMFCDR